MTDDDERRMLEDIGREWLEARGIIMAFLRELQPAMRAADLEHNAAAIIARLSYAGFALTKVGEV